MAVLFPSIEIIKKLKPYPTEGELTLINKLKSDLDDSYNIYFQPFLDGDNPDIVVLNELGGVFIIEVKDWNLSSYIFNKFGNSYGEFKLIKNGCTVGNPFQQVTKYKNNIFGMHIEELYIDKEKNPHLFGQLVKVGVYFHKENDADVKSLFNTNLKYLKFINKWGYDSHISNDIVNSIGSTCMYMNNKLYKEFHRIFKPAFHKFEEGIDIHMSEKQKELSISKPKSNVKIKGIAGSGKTLVLANRAVSATKRTGERVLILTFNITLKNYIKDKISLVRENFHWDNFYITNYHSFISNEIKKLGGMKGIDRYNDKQLKDFFEQRNSEIDRFYTILIDEGQDFEKIWFENLKDNFLVENGEFVIFADEKQNIYDRELDSDKKTVTNIIGRWNELKQSFRMNNDIFNLAIKFQKHFLENKYNIDEVCVEQLSLLIVQQDIKYEFNCDITYLDIFNKVREYIKVNNIHNNDVCIVGTEIEPLRELEYISRTKYNFKFERTIETKEEYEFLSKKNYNSKEKIEALRRNRKKHFYLDSGKMKIATIHSFKGWEIGTLVVIIDSNEESLNNELIYTALTRCTKNLLIFNRGNEDLHDFFVNVSISPRSTLYKFTQTYKS